MSAWGLLAPLAVGCIVIGLVAAWERWGLPWGRTA
jgi:hypothetical protein